MLTLFFVSYTEDTNKISLFPGEIWYLTDLMNLHLSEYVCMFSWLQNLSENTDGVGARCKTIISGNNQITMIPSEIGNLSMLATFFIGTWSCKCLQ
jgi:hypothetical protein